MSLSELRERFPVGSSVRVVTEEWDVWRGQVCRVLQVAPSFILVETPNGRLGAFRDDEITPFVVSEDDNTPDVPD